MTRIVPMIVLAGALTLPVGLAHAGGGGAGGTLEVAAFQCYVVDGARTLRTATLIDQFGERTDVKLDNARLLCTPTTVNVNEGELASVDPFLADHLKCYGISSRTRFNPRVEVRVTDPLGEEILEVRDPRYLCIQAIKELVNPD